MEANNIPTYYEIKQRSEEWKELKRGTISSSNFKLLMQKRGFSVASHTYAKKIVGEKITEVFEEEFLSKPMKDGIEREPYAIKMYEEETLEVTEEIGFIKLPILNSDKKIIGYVGCSPDRLVGKNGGVEVKCPSYEKHTSNLMADECPKDYYDQIQGCLYITKRKWWDFVSYNPNFKNGYQIRIIRVYPDIIWQKTFKTRLIEFAELINDYESKLHKIS